MTIELSASEPAMAVFSAGLVLTTMVFIAAAGNSPPFTVGFRVGCSVIRSTIVRLIS